jgi:hypothetical protein
MTKNCRVYVVQQGNLDLPENLGILANVVFKVQMVNLENKVHLDCKVCQDH